MADSASGPSLAFSLNFEGRFGGRSIWLRPGSMTDRRPQFYRRAAALLGLGVKYFAELIPVLAHPALQAHLREVLVDSRARVNDYTRQHARNDNILQILGLLENILAGQVTAALLDDLFEDHALRVSEDVVHIRDIDPWHVLFNKGAVVFHTPVVLPL